MCDVKRLTSLSRATINRQVKSGRFPKPVSLTPDGRVAWRAEEVEAWAADPLGWGDEIAF